MAQSARAWWRRLATVWVWAAPADLALAQVVPVVPAAISSARAAIRQLAVDVEADAVAQAVPAEAAAVAVVRLDLPRAAVVAAGLAAAVAVAAEEAVPVERVAEAPVADPTEPQPSAIAQAADAGRNGKPVSRTIFRIRR
jgi:hypothetical protein